MNMRYVLRLLLLSMVVVGCISARTLIPADTPESPKPQINFAVETATPTIAATSTPTLLLSVTSTVAHTPQRTATKLKSTAIAIRIVPTNTKLPTRVATNPPAATHAAVPQPGAGIQLIGLTSPISKGAYATITVQTTPGASCSITVIYKSGPSHAAGLDPKTTGGDGRVSWTWKVGTNTTPGTWSIVIACS